MQATRIRGHSRFLDERARPRVDRTLSPVSCLLTPSSAVLYDPRLN